MSLQLGLLIPSPTDILTHFVGEHHRQPQATSTGKGRGFICPVNDLACILSLLATYWSQVLSPEESWGSSEVPRATTALMNYSILLGMSSGPEHLFKAPYQQYRFRTDIPRYIQRQVSKTSWEPGSWFFLLSSPVMGLAFFLRTYVRNRLATSWA